HQDRDHGPRTSRLQRRSLQRVQFGRDSSAEQHVWRGLAAAADRHPAAVPQGCRALGLLSALHNLELGIWNSEFGIPPTIPNSKFKIPNYANSITPVMIVRSAVSCTACRLLSSV